MEAISASRFGRETAVEVSNCLWYVLQTDE